MHYALCNFTPFSLCILSFRAPTLCVIKNMHYDSMHYENFDCIDIVQKTTYLQLHPSVLSRIRSRVSLSQAHFRIQLLPSSTPLYHQKHAQCTSFLPRDIFTCHPCGASRLFRSHIPTVIDIRTTTAVPICPAALLARSLQPFFSNS